MAKIYIKRTKRFKPYITKTLSTLLIILSILISYLPISMSVKVLLYLFCFMENFVILNVAIDGIVTYPKGLRSVNAYNHKEDKEDKEESVDQEKNNKD